MEYALQACVALAVAHAKGIVHRDIKPENLFLSRRDAISTVKVLDFGISKAALTGSVFGGPLPTLSPGKTLGTPLYMSPEQIRSSDTVDARSDIWSLGVVIYELIAGVAAFNSGGSAEEVCAEILSLDPPRLDLQRPEVSEGLAIVIERCLRKEATERYASVAELAVALLPFAPKRARPYGPRHQHDPSADGGVSQAGRALGHPGPSDERQSAADGDRDSGGSQGQGPLARRFDRGDRRGGGDCGGPPVPRLGALDLVGRRDRRSRHRPFRGALDLRARDARYGGRSVVRSLDGKRGSCSRFVPRPARCTGERRKPEGPAQAPRTADRGRPGQERRATCRVVGSPQEGPA
jgi:hypothetical protein